ncbi:MAG: mechanosensitive ion channel family protein [Candidatus Micrarchaeota archaeon]
MDFSGLASTNFSELGTKLAVFAGIVAVSLVAAKIVYLIMERYARRLTRKTKTTLDDRLLAASEGMIRWLILILGLYAACYYAFEGTAYLEYIAPAFVILAILWMTKAALSMGGAFLDWYAEEGIGTRGSSLVDVMPTIKRIYYAFVLIIGLIMVLTRVGIEVSPLIASLGVAGLAVALAFQDTLANFFAGVYLGVDRPVKAGDYVKLDSGGEGYIVRIGWRNTHIRMLSNNMVIIPNSKLSQAVVINHSVPSKDMSVLVGCSVSYDSDLKRVEKIALEVAEEAQKKVNGAVPDFKPMVRFGEFADSGINFNVILRTQEFVGQYELKHEFIKALHARFKQEGIEIPYPKRDVYMKERK